jgi:predicted unusual protein kinase regulating ubiquinone biosynthesis (AarF/ABC1/UbiB family)
MLILPMQRTEQVQLLLDGVYNADPHPGNVRHELL